MIKYILSGVLCILLINCNKKTESPVQTVNSDSVQSAEPVLDSLGTQTFCYMGISGKDSIFISIDDNLGTVTGKMFYKNLEKDRSKGDLSGFRSGDTLKLTYEFVSEGRFGKRDIFFIQKDNSLTEGIGNQKDDNGEIKYENEKNISYKDSQKFIPADCQTIGKAMK